MSRYYLGDIELTDETKMNLFENTLSFRSIANSEGLFEIHYGYDHAMGYFIQFYPKNDIAEEYLKDMKISECIDIDSLFECLEGIELSYFLNEIVNSYDDLNVDPIKVAQHIDFLALDLPI